jgi:hypothetical protein
MSEDALHAGNDDIIPHFQEFAARIHRHGTSIMCQLSHLGGRTHWRADHWLPVVAPSRYREPMHRAVSKEMDRHEASSENDGVTDVDALAAGRAQDFRVNPDAWFRLYQIGDAVASRDIHAAILDALRLCKDF